MTIVLISVLGYYSNVYWMGLKKAYYYHQRSEPILSIDELGNGIEIGHNARTKME